MVVLSTGCTIAVNCAFNLLGELPTLSFVVCHLDSYLTFGNNAYVLFMLLVVIKKMFPFIFTLPYSILVIKPFNWYCCIISKNQIALDLYSPEIREKRPWLVTYIRYFRHGPIYRPLASRGVTHFYRPRSRGDNAFGSLRLFVCLSVCPSSQVSYTLKKHHRVCISTSIQNGWAFKMVAVSTGCAIAVDHAFNTKWVYSLGGHNIHLWPNMSNVSSCSCLVSCFGLDLSCEIAGDRISP